MAIDDNVKNAHGHFSETNVKLLEYIENNPPMLNRANFKIMELNDNVFRLQPWPTFIGKLAKKTMESAGVGLFNLIKQIPGKLFANDPEKISRYFSLPLDIAKLNLVRLQDQLKYLVGRGDFIFSPSGWKCIEYNVTANLGGWQSPFWEPLYLSHPLISKFIQTHQLKIENYSVIEHFFDFIINAYISDTSGKDSKKSEINIAFQVASKLLDLGEPTKIYLRRIYQNKLKAVDSRLKGQLLFCPKKDLHRQNDRIFLLKDAIDILIWLDFESIPSDIIDVFKNGNIELCNGPVADFLSNKMILTLLSENENTGVFSPKEEKLIKEHIPWSRRLEPELEGLALRRQHELVLKPGLGHGGEGIQIGRNTTAEKWRQAIIDAIEQEGWLIQEYVDTPSFKYQYGSYGSALHSSVWGFFIMGSNYTGQWVRVLPESNRSGIINCHQGAEVSVVFEIVN